MNNLDIKPKGKIERISSVSWFNTWRVLLCVLLSVGFLSVVSSAADLNIETDKLFLAETIHVDAVANQASGISQVFSIEGKLFLAVPLRYTIIWDEQTPKMKISADQFMLVDQEGDASPVLGELKYYSSLKTYFYGISASRPSKWQEKDNKSKKITPVFAIQKPGAEYVLKIGESEVPLKAPENTIALGPRLIASIKITAADKVEEVNTKLSIAKTDYQTTVYPLAGTYLKVNIRIDPKSPTKFEDEHFYWNTSWFGLMDENGSFSPVAGEIFMGKLSDNVSHNKNKTSSGWKIDEKTLYFSVAKRHKKFTLYCLGKPVAKIILP